MPREEQNQPTTLTVGFLQALCRNAAVVGASGQTGTEAWRCSTANAKFVVPDLDPRERARSACQSAAAQPQPNAAQPALHSRDSPRDSAPAPRAIDETPIDTRQLSQLDTTVAGADARFHADVTT